MRQSPQTFLFDEAVPIAVGGDLIIDYFAGGGGASHGIERALGRSPDVAINHSPSAIAMHEKNHPRTHHIRACVWSVSARRQLPVGRVKFFWASPDCGHFSKAKGGKPLNKKIRGLAWVVPRVMGQRRPEVSVVENVIEFMDWGPLNKHGKPNKNKKGQHFRKWLRQIRALGAEVEHRILDAADYGAPTHRKRLFVIARLDGLPIVWPEPTHGPGRAHPYRTAAECIDWTIPVPSIFGRTLKDGTPDPLAEATQRRIAEGLKRFVFENQRPFIVSVNHGRDVNRSRDAGLPMPTITSHNGFAVVAPTLVQTGYGERPGQTPRALDIQAPLGTVVACGVKHALVTAWLAKHYTGVVGHLPTRPIGTITTVDHHSVVTACLTKYHGETEGRVRAGQPVDEPLHTIDTAPRFGVVAAHLTKFYGSAKAGQTVERPAPTITATGQHIGLVAAFCVKYYGQGVGQPVSEPLHTIVTKARFGLVTIDIDGQTYALVDIGLRMLTPRELARCQGFDERYQLVGTQAEQVAAVGHSVSPPLAEAIVRSNYPHAVVPVRVGSRRRKPAERTAA